MALVQMQREGKTRREMAQALGRSECAVGCQFTYRNRHRIVGAQRVAATRKVINFQHITITHPEVPDYYELGWRFVGFKGDLCKFEWQSEKEPRWPEQMREAA